MKNISEIPRERLSYEDEKRFVNGAFEFYEQAGFARTFKAVYEDKEHDGEPFLVLGRVKELAEDPVHGANLECLPMWHIRFKNGVNVDAYPEEICLAEQ